jgi:transposase-like protein
MYGSFNINDFLTPEKIEQLKQQYQNHSVSQPQVPQPQVVKPQVVKPQTARSVPVKSVPTAAQVNPANNLGNIQSLMAGRFNISQEQINEWKRQAEAAQSSASQSQKVVPQQRSVAVPQVQKSSSSSVSSSTEQHLANIQENMNRMSQKLGLTGLGSLGINISLSPEQIEAIKNAQAQVAQAQVAQAQVEVQAAPAPVEVPVQEQAGESQ